MIVHDHRLGEPIGSEGKSGDWTFRHYSRGSVYRHPQHGAREIPAPIRDYWLRGLVHKLGFPTGDLTEARIAGRPLRVMPFEHGQVYWDVGTNYLFDVITPSPDEFFKALAPALFGKWDMPFEQGVVGVHAALLHTNEVIFWTYHDALGAHEHSGQTVEHGEWSLLSLSTGKQIIKKQQSERNQFCAGQCLLGDGNLLVIGGDRDTPLNDTTVRVYDPTTRTWKDLPNLAVGRWYPTIATAGHNFALAVGGEERTAGVPHSQNPTAQTVYETGAVMAPHEFDVELKALKNSTYPFVFVLPGAKYFIHLAFRTRIVPMSPLDFDSATKLAGLDATSRTFNMQGTAVLLPLRPTDSPPYRARVMMIGGGNGTGLTPAKDSCEILDLGEAKPAWKPATPMPHRRVMPDSVLLPDGRVLVVNGSLSGAADGGTEPVYEADMYDPATKTWTTLAPMKFDRLYHATALLLPDGRVLSAGTDREWNPKGFDYAHTEVEVFYPPYLFWGPRPNIGVAPGSALYGKSFTVATEQAESIKSVALIRNGSCTHSFNSDQRFVELEIKQRLGPRLWVKWTKHRISFLFGSLTIHLPQFFVSLGLELQAPPDAGIAPPGYYMLFLVSEAGVPSEAAFVRIG